MQHEDIKEKARRCRQISTGQLQEENGLTPNHCITKGKYATIIIKDTS